VLVRLAPSHSGTDRLKESASGPLPSSGDLDKAQGDRKRLYIRRAKLLLAVFLLKKKCYAILVEVEDEEKI
jgi:hypothetical protein